VTVSTHVLDLVTGSPAAGVGVTLERLDRGQTTVLASSTTDEDGRVPDLSSGEALDAGTYRLVFDTGGYGNEFYPEVAVVFRMADGHDHHHVPLLLSSYGYSTYRGS
jgi:5-hydroxyisourate hydrolase